MSADASAAVFAVRKLPPRARSQLKELWLQGRVCGFFNLPTPALFDACTDFVVLDDAAAPAAAPADEAAECSNKELRTRCKRAEHDARQASQQADKQRRRVETLEDERQALQSQVQRLTAQLSKLETHHAVQRAALAAEHAARFAALSADCAELRSELADERSAMRDLILENRDLQRQVSELQREKEAAFVNQLFSEPPSVPPVPAADWQLRLSQNDHINQRLLKAALQMDFSAARSRLQRQQQQEQHRHQEHGDDDDNDDEDEESFK